MFKISETIAQGHYGITSKHEKMPNNELRFRLCSAEGSGYIKTIAGNKGAWQNSHFHHSLAEMYIVEKGWMALATLVSEKLKISIYHVGEYTNIEANVSHNIYLPTGAEIHTVKYGPCTERDWHQDKALDLLSHQLTEKDLLSQIQVK